MDEVVGYIDHKILSGYLLSISMKLGLNSKHAEFFCNGIMYASLRGIDTHGIRLFPIYCNLLKSGKANIKPKITTVYSEKAVINVDADYALGMVGTVSTVNEILPLAEKYGVAVAAIRNSNHFGTASYYSEMLADNDCIGIVSTNSDPVIAAPGGLGTAIGTNPISIAVKGENDDILCFDLATSQTSFSRIQQHKEFNEKLDKGWAQNKDGDITIDPNNADALLPLGGVKGFCLALGVEVLCAGLSDGSFTGDISYVFEENRKHEDDSVSHNIIAISTKKRPMFKTRISTFIKYIREIDAIDENVPVRIPGDRGKKVMHERLNKGIPVTRNQFQKLSQLARDFNEKFELTNFIGDSNDKN